MTRLRKQKTAIVSFSVLLAATTGGVTAQPLVAAWIVNPVLTQMLGASAFPLPTNVPVGTTIRIGGSSSMETINQVLKRRFEQQFVGTDVVLNTQGTGPAIKDVLDGNADLAAIGRSLTAQEKAQGLVPVPVSRHKIAVIVGTQNPFKGDLTFEQFAKIFRGEIKDWSQLGGVREPLRFIDRPDNSDTRQAFRNYPVFKKAPFVTGKTARHVADSTSQVVQALGSDGIGYAIADQLEGRGDVRVLTMHKTLPSNPKYPFSQPLIYVYKGPQPNPSAQAFLGFASAPASRKTIEAARKEATALLTANPDVAVPKPTVSVSVPPAVRPTASTTPQATSPPSPNIAETALANAVPWWPWLLALPLLGGLFWWLLKDREKHLELEEPLSESMEPDVSLEETIVPLPEIIPPLLEAARSTSLSRIILVPRNCTDAYAYWEIPVEEKAVLQQQGARKLVLRLYDVTGVDLQQQPPVSLQEFDCHADAQDRHLPIRTADRDYLAELGYIAEDGRWLQVARSEPIHVPACPIPQPPLTTDAETPVGEPSPVLWDDAEKSDGIPLADTDGAEAGTGVAEDSTPAEDADNRTMLAGDRSRLPLSTEENRIILVPRNHTEVYAYWDVTAEAKESLQQQGGQTLALRLYEVLDGAVQAQRSPHCRSVEVDESASSQALPIPAPDRQYVVELGYLTNDDRWLKLVRSLPLDVSSPQAAPVGVTGTRSMAAGRQAVPLQAKQRLRANNLGALTPSFMAPKGVNGQSDDRTSKADQATSQREIFLVPRNSQSAYIYWTVSQADKDTLKHQGGQQLVLRVYDVMGIEATSGHSVQQFVCNEWECDQQVPIPVSNVDYVAELGYTTLDGRFLTLARSPATRVSGA